MKIPPTHRRLQKPTGNALRDTDLMKMAPDLDWVPIWPEMVGDDLSNYSCPLARLRTKPKTSNADRFTFRATPVIQEFIERGMRATGASESEVIRATLWAGMVTFAQRTAEQACSVDTKPAETSKPSPKLGFWERMREKRLQRSLTGVRF